MDRFEAIRTLITAVDGGSLSAASRRLGVPLPTVSRRVSDLEAHLRTQLVVRTSRRLLLTDAGRAYVAACRQIIEELDDAERLASGEYRTPRGELLITAPVMFGRLHIQPVVLDFLAAYLDITVRLTLSDAIIDIVENRVDLAVRIGELPDSGLVVRRLGAVRWITCASPGYLARRGSPATPQDLVDHDCVGFERVRSDSTWLFSVQDRATAIAISPRFSVNTANGAMDAALAGAGIIRVLSYQAAQAIVEGRLTKVLQAFETEPQPVQLVHNPQAILPLKLRAFLDFAAPRLKAGLADEPG
ncbi:LysR family transcriptional regulator [Novosphingobium pentaromativorans]|uniref:Transcriptional regulator GstR n=1 Tax=Novosphingobium pentaromativorans US6-1 TaxID=1088721 RepID=G6EFU2_9SPHN|nr:LysR family transcriptional regulator [Novosphingobium pentaromativorans]AIT81796.1 LysR family transcriptional regulator [Novosphingobium pentaromativorans US6-1]EHJ59870.1 Transcriptional regulator GstR [Novosphingobium pentaromativorans US6-1]